MKLNRELLRKVAARIRRFPERYSQKSWAQPIGGSGDDATPACKTAACIAGTTAIVMGRRTVKAIQDFCIIDGGLVGGRAGKALGLRAREARALFGGAAEGWPLKYRTAYWSSLDPRRRAEAAASLLEDLASGKVKLKELGQ